MSRLIVLSRAWNADARGLAVAPCAAGYQLLELRVGDLVDLVVAVAGHARRLAR
jgi:hypothetical protein